MNSLKKCAVIASAVALLAGCGSAANYTLPGNDDGSSGGPPAGAANCEELFTEQVQPRLDFCRSCHIPGGIADVDDGRKFMLAEDETQDLENLRTAWDILGRNEAGKSRILKMASGTDSRSHTGGSPWPEGSEAYVAMDALLAGFEDPQACTAGGSGGGATVSERPLLGSKRGGHVWFDFCEGQADEAQLPADPRALVLPGVNGDKAVHFNAYWRDCRQDPALIGEQGQPKNCGELRAMEQKGERLMYGFGAEGSGSFFAGDSAEGGFLGLDASAIRNLWVQWGLTARPDNFDELLTERYGMPFGPLYERNPYPLEGEDPQASNGGSGRLPAFMTQLRGADGEWTGRIGFTCHACHSGAAGLPEEGGGFMFGSGNPLQDIGLMSREVGVSGMSPGGVFSLFGTSRGTNNASAVNVFFLINQDDPFAAYTDPALLDVLMSGSTASGDTPAWWNMGHRPTKFQDGYFATDSSRVDVIFYTPIGNEDGGQAWVREHAQAADKWALSLKAPAYPLPVNTSLAEQGAILFHSKDLWAVELNNPLPKPAGGNGSCASCHGAYSPRYVHDPVYLDDPALEGIASYIVAKDVIRTDPARVDTNNDAVNEYGATSFLGYSESLGTPQECGPQNRPAVRGNRPYGYLAPPLYGVWATAPYLHNGSVPDIWTLLKPEERPELWRRVSAPKRADQQAQPGVVMGFDFSLARAYDEDAMGWRYDRISCASGSTTLPLLDCDPVLGGEPAAQLVLEQLYGNVLVAWNLGNAVTLTQLAPQQVEDRKIYNTNLYGQSNTGHDFTSVLTDAERRALIEYLKTL